MNSSVASSLSPAQLQARLAADSPPLLLDVREYAEFAGGRLPGSQVLPMSELEQRAGDLPRDRDIITVCRTGKRSADAAAKLSRLGFSNVTELGGGLLVWEKEGLPLERDAKAPWALERQVRLVAGVLILLGLALSHVWPIAIALAWFVPAGLIFASITDSCAMGMLIARLPWNQRTASACNLTSAKV